MTAYNDSGWFLGIVTLVLGIPSSINAWVSLRIHKTVKDVSVQVTTKNNQTIAQIQDANETRRIDAIPLNKRDKTDRSHMRSVEEHEDKEEK